MKWNVAIAAVVLANVLGAGSAVAQVVNLGNSGPGGVYLFSGPVRLGDRIDASGAAFRIIGAPGDRLGGNIIAADINGDGYRDIIMSAASTGRIYVIFGGPSLSGTRDLSAGPADL